jgi:prophage antirepressor-like protein
MSNKKMTTKVEIDSEISTAITEKKETIDDNERTIGLKGKAIKFALDVFTFVGIKFAFVIVGDIIYFRAKEIAEYLGYSNPRKAIRDHVDPDDRKTLRELFWGNDSFPHKKYTSQELEAIYITEAGLYQLIFGSKKEEAKEFKKFVTHDLLPNLRKNGSYSISSFVKDTSFATSFFLTHDITAYKNQSIVYIGAVGTYNGKPVYKFGMSDNIESGLKQHIDFYGNQFIMIAVYVVQNNYTVENNIKSLIQSQGIQLKIKINDVNQTEIFTTDNINPILFNVHQLSLQKTPANQQISETLLIEMEKTKQKELELEIIKEKNKSTITEPLKIESKCVFKRFLCECTKETHNVMDKVYSSVLYNIFIEWHKHNYPDARIPSHKEFVIGLKKYKIVKDVRINNKTKTGVEYIIIN